MKDHFSNSYSFNFSCISQLVNSNNNEKENKINQNLLLSLIWQQIVFDHQQQLCAHHLHTFIIVFCCCIQVYVCMHIWSEKCVCKMSLKYILHNSFYFRFFMLERWKWMTNFNEWMNEWVKERMYDDDEDSVRDLLSTNTNTLYLAFLFSLINIFHRRIK